MCEGVGPRVYLESCPDPTQNAEHGTAWLFGGPGSRFARPSPIFSSPTDRRFDVAAITILSSPQMRHCRYLGAN